MSIKQTIRNYAKDYSKKWVRPLLIPIIRALIRYMPSKGIRYQLWVRVVIPFFEYADYNFVAKTKFGSRIAGNNIDMIQRYIYYFGVWEPNLTRFLNERLKEGDIFVDVGANIGYFTLQAAKLVSPSGKVIAIEASPKIFKKLIANLQRNHVTNVETYNLAASETEGTTRVFLASMSNEGQTTILPTEDHWRYECDIPTKPLSTLISADEIAKVRLIKIDVEGAEWFVVSGMRTLLTRARQDLEVVVEISPKRLQSLHRRPEDILEIFSQSGFIPYCLENDYSTAGYLHKDHRKPARIREPILSQVDVIFSRKNADWL